MYAWHMLFSEVSGKYIQKGHKHFSPSAAAYANEMRTKSFQLPPEESR